MSNYTPIVAYGPKDALSPGDPNKVIHGTQQDAELAAIATAISSKADTSSVPSISASNTFTAENNFTSGLMASGGSTPGVATTGVAISGRSADAVIDLVNSSAAANSRVFVIYVDNTGGLHLAASDDTYATGHDGILISQTGGYPTSIKGWGPQTVGPVDMTPDKGSFTGTFSGYASSPTATVYWARSGNFVTLLFTGGQGTSNADNFAMSGLPSYLYPATTKLVAVPGGGIVNSSATVDSGAGRVSLQIANSSLSGLLSFFINGSGYSWATSGTKGIASPTEITYTLL